MVEATRSVASALRTGASPEAIRAHYDLSNEFFALWLDETMTYSGARWLPGDSLKQAQLRKLDLHIARAGASKASSVLDIGCGWGSMLLRLREKHDIGHLVGLTLSNAQAEYIRAMQLPGVDVRVEGWRDHAPQARYDSIISIGAIEHFVHPESTSDERVATYTEFFECCRQWLSPEGTMSLQSIAYGRGGFKHGAIASIFPESDLPRISQLASALEGRFEILTLQSDASDYARTCRAWLERLKANRMPAEQLVGVRTVRHYESFLEAAARGFDARVFVLVRMQVSPLS